MSSFFAVAFLVFLAGTCLAYFVLPKAVRPYWLLVCSYLFYMYDPENASFVALLLSLGRHLGSGAAAGTSARQMDAPRLSGRVAGAVRGLSVLL